MAKRGLLYALAFFMSCFAAMSTIASTTATTTANALELKISHVLPSNETIHESLVKMGKDLEEKSGGFFKVNVYANFEEIISCAGLCVTIAVVSANVVLRYFANKSIAWAEEVSVIGFSCVIFIGSAAVFKRHMHVGVDFLVSQLSHRGRSAVSFVASVFVLLFNAYITYLGWIYAVESWDKPTFILHIPYFFVALPICIGFASMTVYAAKDLHSRLRKNYHGGVTQRFKEGDL